MPITDVRSVINERKNLVELDGALPNYPYALIIWWPTAGALSDSIMIECFDNFDKMQARNKQVMADGWSTRVESNKNLLELMNGYH